MGYRKIFVFIIGCGLCIICLFMGIRWACSLCYDKAIAECQAAATSAVATAAEKRQEITVQIKKIPVSERRKILQRWIIK